MEFLEDILEHLYATQDELKTRLDAGRKMLGTMQGNQGRTALEFHWRYMNVAYHKIQTMLDVANLKL